MLTIEHLEVSYGAVPALFGVSLKVEAGEIVTVIGANGAGKTTLLRAISGIVPVQRGEIRFEGQGIAGLPAEEIVRRGISHVPERRELFAEMTVRENLELGGYSVRQRDNRRRQSIGTGQRQMLVRDLESVWEMFPILRARQAQKAGTLSGGEQQMLAIARGLMAHPKLLLLDEPSLGLAPLLVREVLRIVSTLREMGRTVLLVEQNAAGALQIADRAYLMEGGRIVLQGSSHDLLNEERVRRAYLGRRVAPPERPQENATPPGPRQRRQEGRRGGPPPYHAARREAERGEVYAGAATGFTLPDEYFERRAGLSRDEIEALQDEALPRAYAYAFERTDFYAQKFRAAGLTPDSIRGLHDLQRLPYTTPDEIRLSPAQGDTSARLLAVEQETVSLVHTSSGTTGSPKVLAYTGRDVAQWAANTATVFWINGLRKTDIVLGLMPFGEFTGGGGVYLGMICLGAAYIPIATQSLGSEVGIPDKVLAHLTGRIRNGGGRDTPSPAIDPLLRANALVSLASFLPRLEEMLDRLGLRADDLALNKISCGAEPSSDAVRTRIAERFGIWPRDNYGLGECYGPGVAAECEVGGGLHVLSDAFIAEVIDPETEEPAAAGEMGELTLTSLNKEAFPLFRYRTGDRTMALPQNCACGSAHTWVGRVPGRIRTDDIMIPRDMLADTAAINRTHLEDILLHVDGSGAEYAVTVKEHPPKSGHQRLHILIEGDAGAGVAKTIVHRVQIAYGHTPVVTLVPRGSLPRPTGKAQRVLTPEAYTDLETRYL